MRAAIDTVAAPAVFQAVVLWVIVSASVLIGCEIVLCLRFTTIDAGVAARGWQLVLLLRLSPLVPFGPLNYALGLTR